MARSLSHAKVFVSLIADNLSILHRRGFAAATEGVAGLRRRSGRIGKSAEEEMVQAAESSWIPDPVTGYYRPANRASEIDGAELREIFLKQKFTSE